MVWYEESEKAISMVITLCMTFQCNSESWPCDGATDLTNHHMQDPVLVVNNGVALTRLLCEILGPKIGVTLNLTFHSYQG